MRGTEGVKVWWQKEGRSGVNETAKGAHLPPLPFQPRWIRVDEGAWNAEQERQTVLEMKGERLKIEATKVLDRNDGMCCCAVMESVGLPQTHRPLVAVSRSLCESVE